MHEAGGMAGSERSDVQIRLMSGRNVEWPSVRPVTRGETMQRGRHNTSIRSHRPCHLPTSYLRSFQFHRARSPAPFLIRASIATVQSTLSTQDAVILSCLRPDTHAPSNDNRRTGTEPARRP
jgi:hypothetical protein